MTILELKQRTRNRNNNDFFVLPTTTTATTTTTPSRQQQHNKLRPYKKQLALPFKKFQKYITLQQQTTTALSKSPNHHHPSSSYSSSSLLFRSINSTIAKRGGGGSDTKSSFEKITVSTLTYKIIQLEVERLLYEANRTQRPLTVQSMSNALIGSRHIQESYVESSLLVGTSTSSTSTTAIVASSSSSNRLRGGPLLLRNTLSSLTSSILRIPIIQHQQQQRNRNQKETKYKYEWMKIMNQLQNERTSQEQIVANWEDAENVLLTVLQVDGDNDNNDNENGTNRNDGKEATEISSSDGAIIVVREDTPGKPTPQKNDVITDSVVDVYIKRLEALKLEHIHQSIIGLSPAQHKWQEIAVRKKEDNEIDLEKGLTYDEQKLIDGQEVLDAEYKKLEEKLKSTAIKELDEQIEKEKEQQNKIQELLQSLLRPLTDDEQTLVQSELYNTRSNPNEVIAQVGTDTLVRRSLQTLIPGSWLNDEVVHYFLIMLSKRDEILCAQQQQAGRKRSHFFKSFFMTKLRNEGHPTLSGQYDYKQVKRWSKNVPGKDLFALDKIIFPINEGQMHWVCACIFIQERRIQFYDSLGSSGMEYINDLFRYIQDEHIDKKKKPLPDADQWQLIPCTKDTPRQLNGYDCGVFTCMFADFLSMDYPLVFGQQHVTECRQRIALSILQGKAIM